MDPTTRKSLTQALSKLSVEIAAALRAPMRQPGPVADAARALHAEEQVGDGFDLWTDLLSRRAAVLWVLKSLYVRILEDRGLLQPRRIVGAEDELFAHLAPSLGPTAYLTWVFRDLAEARGGLPELFAPQPAELPALTGLGGPAGVPDALSQRLLDFWRTRDTETGALVYRFDDERFDSRLMGDLYQDLDPVVKKRYALLQTPEFVLDFILDETLTPAIAEWGVETVRVLDPACGSGHFLLAAFGRLCAGMRAKYPTRPVPEIVRDVLSRVVGIDLNDYACALARARLVMTALETCGETSLAAGAELGLHPSVYWADALEQVEEAEQLGLGDLGPDTPLSLGLLTPPEVRAALKPVLTRKFHTVVGNPTYITEKDPKRREYHKAKQGKRRRYISASGKYSLGAPFTERMLQLAVDGGFVGEITADSFMKREFGKALIEDVLGHTDLTQVVATSGAYIPGHGTPTVLLFARRRAPHGATVRVVMGKRGEPGRPADAAKGKVWSSIVEGHGTPGFESEFISVADVPRATMAAHPWSIGGGGAAELKEALDEGASVKLDAVAASIGITSFTLEDDVYTGPRAAFVRNGVPATSLRAMVLGDSLRDWAMTENPSAVFPYDLEFKPDPTQTKTLEFLWPARTNVASSILFGGKSKVASGMKWFEYGRLTGDKLRIPLSITFAFKATHNHFVLDRGGKVFNRTAPVIKLPVGSTDEQHLVLLAQLNASVGEFWVKQTCQTTGGPGGGKTSANDYENFYERDGSKLERFPLAATTHPALSDFARRLDRLATERLEDSPAAVLAATATAGAPALRSALDARRTRDLTRLFQMVGLQEELDWLCYSLYGVDLESDARAPEAVPPLTPGYRPFEVTLAKEDAERREALARGEEPDEAPTQWFTRHGWEPPGSSALEALPEGEAALVKARIERTQASRELSLLEQPTYKRRWYKPDHAKEEREAMELWLDDRVEAWAKERGDTAGPFSAAQIGAAFRADPGVLAVGELLTGRADFDVDALVDERVRLCAVPNLKHHVFKPEGLLKRAAWQRTWDEQHKEDRADPAHPGKPEVPPKYDAKDYLKSEYWALRGKLDVPKERLVAFTELPSASGETRETRETLYAWAGWTSRQRAKAMLGLDEKLEAEGVPVEDRYGLLYGVSFLLPYVAWESPEAARDFRADVRSLVGEQGVTEAMLDAWAVRFPPGRGGKGKAKSAGAAAKPAKSRKKSGQQETDG